MLNARREIATTMTLSENLKSDGSPNLYKLSKPVAEGGLGTQKKWWINRDNDKTRYKQKRFRVDNLVQKGQHPEMEQELSSQIENGREKEGMHKWIRYKSESARNFERTLST